MLISQSCELKLRQVVFHKRNNELWQQRWHQQPKRKQSKQQQFFFKRIWRKSKKRIIPSSISRSFSLFLEYCFRLVFKCKIDVPFSSGILSNKMSFFLTSLSVCWKNTLAVPLRGKIILDLSYMSYYFSTPTVIKKRTQRDHIIKLSGDSGTGVLQLYLANSRIVGFDIVQYLPLSTNLHSHKPLPSYKSSHSKF